MVMVLMLIWMVIMLMFVVQNGGDTEWRGC